MFQSASDVWTEARPKQWKKDMRFSTWNVRDLREIGINGENWIKLAQDSDQWRACVKTEDGNEPSGSIRKQDIF
jgi:hypothetical protein